MSQVLSWYAMKLLSHKISYAAAIRISAKLPDILTEASRDFRSHLFINPDLLTIHNQLLILFDAV
jgi:hypothetical protein